MKARIRALFGRAEDDEGRGILPTLTAEVISGEEKAREARILTDTGAQTTMITAAFAKKVKAKKLASGGRIIGWGPQEGKPVDQMAVFTLRSRFYQFELQIKAAIVPEIADDLRNVEYDPEEVYPSLKKMDMPLADRFPQPANVQIDILIGQDYYWVLGWGRVHRLREVQDERGPVFVETHFGLIMAGRDSYGADQDKKSHHFFQKTEVVNLKVPRSKQKDRDEDPPLEELIRRMFTLESVGITIPEETGLSEREKQAKKMLEEGMEYLGNQKRFRVKIPLDPAKGPLVNNSHAALQRFYSLEKHLERCKLKKDLYVKGMQKYLDKQHAVEVTEEDEDSPVKYYLPHSGVLEPTADGKDVKLRIVFDASCRDVNGLSPNTWMITGRVPDSDIPMILTQYRWDPVAVSCDVAACFLSILMHLSQQNIFRFYWRMPGEKLVRTYKFVSLIFGAANSPFISSYCLFKLMEIYEKDHPESAELMRKARRSLWVDDLLMSFATVDEAREAIAELEKMFGEGSFKLAKFQSSHEEALDGVNEDQLLFPREDGELSWSKVLGLGWQRHRDINAIRADLEDAFDRPRLREGRHTKRTLSRCVASIFDPLCMAAPYKLGGMILLSEAWAIHGKQAKEEGIGKAAKKFWNEPLPDDLHEKIMDWAKDWKLLLGLTMPRCLRMEKEVDRRELHGFSDASPLAFGSMVYLVTFYKNHPPTSNFIIARTRVNSKGEQNQTLPRCELMGAEFLAKMMKNVREWINAEKNEIPSFYWTDAFLVLYWVKQADPKRWKVFVCNRVEKIQKWSNPASWQHVPGLLNPSDLLTRPKSMEEFRKEKEKWFQGPSFIKTGDYPDQPDFTTAPKESEDEMRVAELNEKIAVMLSYDVSDQHPIRRLMDKFSDILRVMRIIAYVRRWIAKVKHKINPKEYKTPRSGKIFETPEEIQEALDELARQAQQVSFQREYKALLAGEDLPATSKLAKYIPCLDEDGFIRVGSRMTSQGEILGESREWLKPIVIPAKHEFTKRLVLWLHEITNHAGPAVTLSRVRERYWPLRGKATIREYLRRCQRCRILEAKQKGQLMAPLPEERTDYVHPPFTHTAMDAIGPLFILEGTRDRKELKRTYKDAKKEKKARQEAGEEKKVWILVFTCMTVRAVHLELLEDMAVESYIGALRRFIASYGKPRTVRLDNFRSHTAMAGEVNKLLRRNFMKKASEQAMELGVRWSWSSKFMPSTNGVVERMCQTVKKALKKTIGKNELTYVELLTLIKEAQMLINNRPLAEMPWDQPGDAITITPNKLILGYEPTTLPLAKPVPETDATKQMSVYQRWCMRQKSTTKFNNLFKDIYLRSLIEAKNRMGLKKEEPIRVGDLCLVAEPNQKRRLDWPLAIVTKVTEGRDGFVRNCMLREANGKEISRSIRSLVFLRHVGEDAQLKSERDLHEEAVTTASGGEVSESGEEGEPDTTSTNTKRANQRETGRDDN